MNFVLPARKTTTTNVHSQNDHVTITATIYGAMRNAVGVDLPLGRKNKMPSLKHIHTYVQFKKRKGDWFRCADPSCSHFIESELAIGKNTKCNECGDTFVLDPESAKRVKPRCLGCAGHKEARAFQAGRDLIKSLGLFDQKPEDGVQNDE